MPAAWSSDHPDVLAWWEAVQKRDRAYRRFCRKVEREQKRGIYVSTGFGDDRVIGLASHSYRENAPRGWKFGNGKRESGFFEPRVAPRNKDEKAACEEAQALIKKLNDKHVSVRKECHDRFGTPVFQMFGLHAISPGLALIDGRLWLTFGEYDYEPAMPDDDGNPSVKMTDYFKPEKLSAYHKAREDAELAGDDG